MSFDSPIIEQLNPDLPTGFQMNDFSLSPDDSKLMIYATKASGTSRKVDYISYRDRFAKAMQADREVADDPFTFEQKVFVVDLTDDGPKFAHSDGKPWEVFSAPAGHEWVQVSVNERPWSADGKQLVFGTWRRDAKELLVQVVDIDKHKVSTALKDTSTGEHSSPGFVRPFFTPDGKKIVVQLDKSGYRQVWLVDPLAQGATQITTGDFETWPEAISKDGKSLFVRASKEDLCREDLYKVDLATREMTRVSTQSGTYGNPVISHDFGKIATQFRNWERPVEEYVLDANRSGREEKLTQSHSPDLAKIQKLKPQLFTFTNRNGQVVHGAMFLPPDYQKSDKRPLMIYTYGGALGEGREVWDGNYSAFVYTFPMYEAYTLGYIAVTIDPRGSSDYSNAFGNANYGHPGVAQVEDLSDGVKYLIANYNVDPTKVGVNGWSFGGFQTQMCMYTAPNVFTLGIAGAGPTEWQNYNNWYVGGMIGPNPLGDTKELDKYSLTHLAKNLQNPLMLLHGMEDTNVLFQDTIHVYRELLKAEKGPLVELVLDPTGSHGLGGDIKTKQRFAIYDGFLRRRWGVYKRP